MGVRDMLRSLRRFLLGLRYGTKKVFEDGSTIRILHREGLEYAHPDGHKMEVEYYWHLDNPATDYEAYLNPWLPPNQDDLIAPEVAEEIARKIQSYWVERGYMCRVHGSLSE